MLCHFRKKKVAGQLEDAVVNKQSFFQMEVWNWASWAEACFTGIAEQLLVSSAGFLFLCGLCDSLLFIVPCRPKCVCSCESRNWTTALFIYFILFLNGFFSRPRVRIKPTFPLACESCVVYASGLSASWNNRIPHRGGSFISANGLC